MATEPYKYEPHKPIKVNVKGIPWLRCQYCGLLYLKNDFTAWCVKMGCNNADHPDYKRQGR